MKGKMVSALAIVSLFFIPLVQISAQDYLLESYPLNHKKSFSLLEEANQSSVDPNELIESIQEANVTVESVEYNATMWVEIQDGSYLSQSIVDALFKLFYDANQTIEYGYLKTTSINDEVEEIQEILMVPGKEKDLYSRSSEGEQWQNLTEAMEVNTYSAYPDYFNLLNIIYSMEADLEILETAEDYILNLKSADIELMELFQEEYDISITGIEESELDKHALFVFNKDDLLLHYLHLSFYTEEERFAFYIDIQTDFGQWNQVNEADIQDLMQEIE